MEAIYEKYLQKICKSESFATSSKTRELLTYLLECSVQGTSAKEIQIALVVFHRNLTENDQDTTIVRVNVHNLRKKLSHYYLTDGVNDEIKFNIPTGRYLVEIIKNVPEKLPNASYKEFLSPKLLVTYSLIIVVSVVSSFFIFRDTKGLPLEKLRKSVLWNDFAKNEKKTMIVVGDYYFFKERNPDFKEPLMVRDYSINSDEDLIKFNSGRLGDTQNYSNAPYSYTGHGTPFFLKELLPLFEGSNYEVCLMSQFNAKYLTQYNIVFVGLYKTMGIFKLYLDHSGFTFDLSSNTINVQDRAGKIVQTFTQTGPAEKFHDDYAIAAKFAGPSNNTVIMVCSFHDTGIVQCIKELTSNDSVEKITTKLSNRFGKIPPGFEILIKVIGVNRSDIKSNIIAINKLDSTNIFWGMK